MNGAGAGNAAKVCSGGKGRRVQAVQCPSGESHMEKQPHFLPLARRVRRKKKGHTQEEGWPDGPSRSQTSEQAIMRQFGRDLRMRKPATEHAFHPRTTRLNATEIA